MPSLIQKLVEKGELEEGKAASIKYEIKTSDKSEEEVILEKRIVDEETLFKLKSKQLDIPLRQPVVAEIPSKVFKIIPEDSARHYNMIALSKKGGIVEVGMVYPEDLKAREALKFLARQGKFSYRVVLISLSTFRKALKRRTGIKGEVSEALKELESEIETKKARGVRMKKTELERLVEEAPIIKVVAVILRHAVEGKASDIHVEPTRKNLRVRFRTEGKLHSSLFLPLKIHPAVVARVKILSRLKIDETRIPQDGRFSTEIGERRIDFRVSTFPTSLGEKLAIRVLDPQMGMKNFEELGFPQKNEKIVREAIQRPYGLILASGPTGCGKTTTLYSILRILNQEEVNIVTLEDPIEYSISGVNQSQVRPKIDYDFATGLRHVLRQDPDIIMVGEIRDPETAALAIHAGLTGHIVLSTIHTNEAIGAIPRLIDLGVPPYLIPPTLNVVIAQRLVRKLCPDCKKKVRAKKRQRKIISRELKDLPSEQKKKLELEKTPTVYKPQGCPKCNRDGYQGRTSVSEVLKMTESLAEITSKEPSKKNLSQEAQRQGMITMEQDAILKALQGITSMEEALRISTERQVWL